MDLQVSVLYLRLFKLAPGEAVDIAIEFLSSIWDCQEYLRERMELYDASFCPLFEIVALRATAIVF